MFKPAPLAQGVLMSGITANTTTLVFNTDLYNKLVDVLGEDSDDTTYLSLGAGTYHETVRVDNLYDGIATVTRGRDSTVPRAFVAGTAIAYNFCSAAVADMLVDASAETIQIYGAGGIDVERDGNQFTVGLTPLNITSDDGSISITGDAPNIDLSVNANAMGLCSAPVYTGG